MAMTASGQFGKKPTTRSPGVTPDERSEEAQAATSARRSEKDRVWRGPSSVQEIKAGRLSSYRRRFSAKLSRAPGNQVGPRSGSGGAMRSRPCTTCDVRSPMIPCVRQTLSQNAAGSAIDHRYNASYVEPGPPNAAMFDRATRSGDGLQSGASVSSPKTPAPRPRYRATG
jgi:hypothetical protein